MSLIRHRTSPVSVTACPIASLLGTALLGTALLGSALLGSALVAAPAHAGSTTSTLLGVVKDPAGSPVAGADVLAVLEGFGTKMTLRTDAKGKFIQVGLKPGTWDLTVSKPGYATQTVPAHLKLNEREPVEVV